MMRSTKWTTSWGMSLALGAMLALPYSGEARTMEKGHPHPYQQGRSIAPVGEAAVTKTARPIPFHGTIATVNQGGRNFTLESKSGTGRTLNITGRTAMTFQGNPAGPNALAKGEMVRGSYWKLPDGSLEAKTVKLGPLTPAEQAAKDQAKAARAARKAARQQEPAAHKGAL